MHRYLARRLGLLVITVVVAVAIAHVFLATAVEGHRVTSAIRATPAYLYDGFAGGDFGATPGGSCLPRGGGGIPDDHVKPCGSYPAGEVVDLLRERVPVDLQLLLGSLLFGTLAGVVGGRICAMRPRSAAAWVLRAATAFLLACPPYFLAFVVLIYFAAGIGTVLPLPFILRPAEFVPVSQDPARWVEEMWLPWVLCALPLAAFVLRMTDNTLREVLHEDYVRTAFAKGLSTKRVGYRHALPVVTPGIAAVAGANVSALLLNVAVIEYGFGIPGLFRTLHAASLNADVPVLMGLVIEGVLLVAIANFLADAVQQMLDPRVRLHA